MSRPLRIEFPGAYYHIMNRGLAHQRVFSDREDYQQFLKLLSECHEMWGVRVLAYCLLGNHYHLLIQTPEANLSRIMRHLDGLYTQRYNRRHKRDGPLFRGRYRAIVVDAEEYLLTVARYIHHNPVEAGLVKWPEKYEWSSCRMYLERRQPLWLEAGQLLSRFSQKDRKKALIDFMRSKIEGPAKAFYEGSRWLPVLGSERFIEQMRRRMRDRQTDLKEVPEAKRYVRPSMQTCLNVVRQVYKSRQAEMMRGMRGQRNEARAMAMYLCRRLVGMKQEEIAKVFGTGGYSAVSSMNARTQAELQSNGRMARRYEEICDLLQR